MKIHIIGILTSIIIALTGCATITEKQSTAQAKIKKGHPVVYIYPMDVTPYKNASLAVSSFQVPTNMTEVQAEQIAALFKNVFLGKRTFPKIKRLPKSYSNTEEAIKAGHQAGVDLVLTGVVNYGLDGTELGGARTEVSIRLLNVYTGNTIWYICQNMDQPISYPKNDFFSRASTTFSPTPIKRANGGSALHYMLSQIAVDMADVIKGNRYVKR